MQIARIPGERERVGRTKQCRRATKKNLPPGGSCAEPSNSLRKEANTCAAVDVSTRAASATLSLLWGPRSRDRGHGLPLRRSASAPGPVDLTQPHSPATARNNYLGIISKESPGSPAPCVGSSKVRGGVRRRKEARGPGCGLTRPIFYPRLLVRACGPWNGPASGAAMGVGCLRPGAAAGDRSGAIYQTRIRPHASRT
jgi:hypothetical protein